MPSASGLPQSCSTADGSDCVLSVEVLAGTTPPHAVVSRNVNTFAPPAAVTSLGKARIQLTVGAPAADRATVPIALESEHT